MDFGSLILVIGAGGLVDVLADINTGKEVIIPIIGASLLIVILGSIGRATGQWELVTALAVLYLLASVMKNYKNVPAIASVLSGKAK